MSEILPIRRKILLELNELRSDPSPTTPQDPMRRMEFQAIIWRSVILRRFINENNI